MNNIFIFNPSASPLDIQDAIEERIIKVKAITPSFMVLGSQNSELSHEMLEGIFWALDDYIEEISCLYKFMLRKKETSNNKV